MIKITDKAKFWIAVYALVITVVMIILAVMISRHECPQPDPTAIDYKIRESQLKIEHYEELIDRDSVAIHNSNRSTRDSLRTAYFLRYLYGDSLH